jgi:EpsG family
VAYALFIVWSLLLVSIAWVKPRHSSACGAVLLVSAVMFAGLRGASNDYAEYVMRYRAMAAASGLPLAVRLYIGKDPWFGGLIMGVQSVGLRVQALFLVSAALALGLKAKAFARLFGTFVTPLFVTICTTYFLHEYTQIRVAIAVGFAFIGLVALCEGRRGLWALCSLLALGFHISTIAVVMCEIPFLVKLDRPFWLAGWGAVCLVAMIAMTNLLSVVSDIVTRVESYESGTAATNNAQILVCLKLAVVSLLTYLVLSAELDPARRRLIKACFFMEIMGVGIFFAFMHSAPGVGFRVMELLDAFSVFIIAAAFMWRSALSWAVAFSYCTAMIILVAVGDLMVPYRVATHPIW